MLTLKKPLMIFNPLEQFEINTPLLHDSNIYTLIINNTNIFYSELYQKTLYTSSSIFNNNNWWYYTELKSNLISYNSYNLIELKFMENPYILNFEDFFGHNTFSIFNFLPTGDFFLVYHFLIITLFFFFYRTCFFLYTLKSPIKFIFFMVLNFLLNTIKNMNNNLIKYSPYLISLFLIILLLNILGLIPFVKSLTSTVSITFFLSLSSFFGLNLEGLLIHKLHFFDKFAPGNVPFIILPGLVIIEIISYLMRPASLAIRLFANMLAGHILIKLFITFCVDLSGVSLFLFIGCFFFICILMTLEVFISFLQAYIFMLLVLLYLNDVINPAH